MTDKERIRKLAEKMGMPFFKTTKDWNKASRPRAIVCKMFVSEYPLLVEDTEEGLSRIIVDLNRLSAEFAEAMTNSKAWGNWDIHKGGPWWYVLHHTTREQIAREKTFGLAVLAAVEGRG